MQPLEEKLKLQRSSLPPSPQHHKDWDKDQPPLVSHKLPKKKTKISSFSHNQREKGDEEEEEEDDDDDECARKEETQVPLRLVIFSEVAVSPNNNKSNNKSNKSNHCSLHYLKRAHSTTLSLVSFFVPYSLP
jgi:hypothetical protein